MSSKTVKTGGYLPNLKIGAIPARPKKDAEAEEKAVIAEKHIQLKKDFRYREKLRRDRGRKR